MKECIKYLKDVVALYDVKYSKADWTMILNII